jgi:hypothetical protein
MLKFGGQNFNYHFVIIRYLNIDVTINSVSGRASFSSYTITLKQMIFGLSLNAARS